MARLFELSSTTMGQNRSRLAGTRSRSKPARNGTLAAGESDLQSSHGYNCCCCPKKPKTTTNKWVVVWSQVNSWIHSFVAFRLNGPSTVPDTYKPKKGDCPKKTQTNKETDQNETEPSIGSAVMVIFVPSFEFNSPLLVGQQLEKRVDKKRATNYDGEYRIGRNCFLFRGLTDERRQNRLQIVGAVTWSKFVNSFLWETISILFVEKFALNCAKKHVLENLYKKRFRSFEGILRSFLVKRSV